MKTKARPSRTSSPARKSGKSSKQAPVRRAASRAAPTPTVSLSPALTKEAQSLGHLLAQLRLARGIKQADAAVKAGLARSTAYRLEKGDAGVALGQLLRYLQAIAPGSLLLDLLCGTDPALATATSEPNSNKRVRDVSADPPAG